jgi:hypothetical protein
MNYAIFPFIVFWGSVLSGTIDDPYDSDKTKVFKSSSPTDRVIQIKETTYQVKIIIRNIKEIT